MPGMSGVDFLREVREQWPETVRIVLSGYADTAAVVSAINEGQIYKFLPKPWNPDELRVTVENALERFFLNRKNKELSQELQAKNEELRILKLSLERIVMEKTEEILLQNRLLSRSQAILDHAPVGVLTADPNGIIVQCNVEAGRILSCGGSEGVFTTPGAVVPEELASCINTSYRDPRTIGEFFIGGMAVQVTVCRFEEEENAKTILALTPTCDGGRD
jgi:two-component system NtrC family sensor kinase